MWMFTRGVRGAFIGTRLRRSLLVGVGVAAISLAFAPGALATTTIDTTPLWSGSDSVSQFGWGQFNTATWGQTVTVPATDTKLDSFTFYVQLDPSVLFRGEVYAWDNTDQHATGPALYESSPMHTTCNTPSTPPCNSSGFQPITLNTGGINLTAGAQYVLFVTVSKDWAANTATCVAQGPDLGSCPVASSGQSGIIPNQDVYPGGDFVYIYNMDDTSKWTTMMWQNFTSQGLFDSAFKASFSSPLPTSKAQCKNGGWKTYGVFKNQGDCVSFVASGGKNPPRGP
jgi:hypothetical protein